MTAIVKHISVHPKFRYARRVGIFDELDKRDAEIKRKQQAKRQQNKMVGYGFMYTPSPTKPTPEN
ncbi:hypothetical protein pEaSNUABM30_00209 [Erwinia phage pEa_SNUABM_30]|uniref:Uncharacterized protein n=1 Tax=Erwinia phage pEa_SNUABM_30 TaxID=2869553 RepID=A0AAE9BRV4_9CAUD|nr:hypothetical protein MPK69_gp209 [Erwinia phage pEa_SNUABM_30]UAW53327.1 hypothetical protein pEaSNUABM30_00209 [Erwinia phage pEa_SNUABM_30]